MIILWNIQGMSLGRRVCVASASRDQLMLAVLGSLRLVDWHYTEQRGFHMMSYMSIGVKSKTIEWMLF